MLVAEKYVDVADASSLVDLVETSRIPVPVRVVAKVRIPSGAEPDRHFRGRMCLPVSARKGTPVDVVVDFPAGVCYDDLCEMKSGGAAGVAVGIEGIASRYTQQHRIELVVDSYELARDSRY